MTNVPFSVTINGSPFCDCYDGNTTLCPSCDDSLQYSLTVEPPTSLITLDSSNMVITISPSSDNNDANYYRVYLSVTFTST